MSSKARQVKSIAPEIGYPHREHRSKKGRRYNPGIIKVRDLKRKLEKIKIKELEQEWQKN